MWVEGARPGDRRRLGVDLSLAGGNNLAGKWGSENRPKSDFTGCNGEKSVNMS